MDTGGLHHEYTPEDIPANRNFSALEGQTWTFPLEPKQGEPSPPLCFHPVVINLQPQERGRHNAFETARHLFRGYASFWQSEQGTSEEDIPDTSSLQVPGTPEVRYIQDIKFVRTASTSLLPDFAKASLLKKVKGHDLQLLLEACHANKECRSVDTLGNLYNCNGGCLGGCCQMYTTMVNDFTDTCVSHNFTTCNSWNADLWTKVDLDAKLEPSVHDRMKNIAKKRLLRAKQAVGKSIGRGGIQTGVSQFVDNFNRVDSRCVKVMILTVPRPYGQSFLVKTLESIMKINQRLST